MDLLQKIDQLKGKYQDPIDQPQLNAWEAEARRLMIVEHVAGSDAVKYLVEGLQADVQGMDVLLLNATSSMLGDSMRDMLLAKKELYKRVIAYFDVEQAKVALEAQIDQN